jgi:UDPglucose 6-dehydrogenase
VIDEVVRLGARVVAYDPVAMENARRVLTHPDIRFAPSALEAATGADALLLLTAWPEFRTIPPEELRAVMATPVVIDGRNLWDPERMRALGFHYRGIGRPSPVVTRA